MSEPAVGSSGGPAAAAAAAAAGAAAGAAGPLPPIVQAGTPVLRQVARAVPPELIGSDWLRQLVATMTGVMRAAPGVGLAAPQIGEPWQVLVMEDRDEYIAKQRAAGAYPPAVLDAMQRQPFGPVALANPVLRPTGQQGAAFFEGCLSVQGYTAVVPRYHEVEVEGLDPLTGERVCFRARGWQARILQHECDHLRGILYVDRMLPRTLCTHANMPAWIGSLPEGTPPLGPCVCCHPIDAA